MATTAAIGYSDTSAIENAMKLVATFIANNPNCKIRWNNKGSVCADIFTGVINIPRMGFVSPETLMKLRLFIYHEGGHICETKLTKPEMPKPPLFSILNGIEDHRMEAVLAKQHEGCKMVFEWGCDYFNKDVGGKVQSGEAAKAPLWEMLCACRFVLAGRSLAWALTPRAQQYFDIAYPIFRKVNNAKNAHDSLDIAKEIYEALKNLLKEEKEEQKKEQEKQQNGKKQKQQKGQEQEEQQSGNGSEGEEDSEEEGDEKQDSKGSGKSKKQDKKEDSEEEQQSGSGEGEEESEEENEEDGEGSGSGDDEEDSDKDEEGKGSSGEKDSDKDEEGNESGEGEDEEDFENDEDGKKEDGEGGEDGADSGSDKSSNEEDAKAQQEFTKQKDMVSPVIQAPKNEPKKATGKPKTKEEVQQELEKAKKEESEIDKQLEDEAKGKTFERVLADDVEQTIENMPKNDAEYTAYREGDVFEVPDVDIEDKTRYMQRRTEVSAAIMGMSRSLDQALRSMQRIKKNPYLEHGKIDMSQLTAIAKSLSKRVFYNEKEGTKLNTALEIVIDESGSMSNSYVQMQLLALALGETLEKIHVPFEIFGASTMASHRFELPELDGFSRTNPIRWKVYKLFNENWNAVKERITRIYHYNNHIDGEVVQFAASRLASHHEKRKVILSLSDGEPCGGQHNDGDMAQNLKDVVARCRKNRIEVYGFGVGTVAPKLYYGEKHFIYLEKAEEMSQTFFTNLAQIITQGQVRM